MVDPPTKTCLKSLGGLQESWGGHQESWGGPDPPTPPVVAPLALSIIRCSKSVQKFAVWVRQVATVVMETMQLVRSQLIFTTRCHAQRGLCRRKMSVCPYFCQSVCHTPVFCRDIQHFIKLFSPSGMHTILVFAALNVMAIFQRAPPNGDVECRSVWKKAIFLIYNQYILLSLCCNSYVS